MVQRDYVDTVGKNAKKIQECIQNQLEEDLAMERETVTGETARGHDGGCP